MRCESDFTAEHAAKMFNPKPHPGEWRTSFPRGGQKIATLLKHRPLGIYRLQANRFDGKSDGKNSQLLGGAGFYRHCLIIHVVNDYHPGHEDPSQASQRRPF